MSRLKTSSGQFGLIGGICRASSDCILAKEPVPPSPAARWKGSLYVLAEPIAEGGRGYQGARQVITEVSQAYYDCSSPSITTCLARAIRKANENLLEHNMQVSGHEKVTVGLTCAVVRGSELFLAQVLPSQAYIVHQGRLQAFPLNPSWDPEATSLPTMMARLLAVGWAEDVSIEFFHSLLRPGDIFCLCTSNIGRFLGKEEAEHILLYQEPGDVVEQLYRRVHQQGFKEGHAVVVEMRPPVSREAGAFFSLAGLRERARLLGEAVAAWGGFIAGETSHLFENVRASRQKRQKVRRVTARAEPAPSPPPETPPLARPKPPGPWWKTAEETIRNIFQPREKYPRLEKPRLRIPPARKRRRLAPFLLAGAALTVLIVLVIVITRGAQQGEQAKLELLLQNAQEQITLAEQTADIAEANRLLDETEQDLRQALSAGTLSTQIEGRLAELLDVRDRINEVTRFGEFELLVDLNAFTGTVDLVSFSGGCVENCLFSDLAVVGETIYALEEEKGTVYRYSAEPRGVIPFLWQGVEVGGHRADRIVDIAALERPTEAGGEATETWLAAVDVNRWVYLHRDGQWEVFTLFSQASWQNRAVDIEGYQGNLYVLKGELGQILKYYSNAYELAPEQWLKGDSRQVRIEDAVDMVIDGSIHVLLKDGTIQTLLQGHLEQTISYKVYPPTVLPSQVAIDLGDLESPFIYVVDRYGRIIQLRKYGDPAFVRQLRGPEDEDLQQMRAAVVRENQGLVYIVAGARLYKAIFPPIFVEPVPTRLPASPLTPTP